MRPVFYSAVFLSLTTCLVACSSANSPEAMLERKVAEEQQIRIKKQEREIKRQQEEVEDLKRQEYYNQRFQRYQR